MISRRKFFSKAAQGFGASWLLPSLQSCGDTATTQGTMMGPNAALGHRLRSMDFALPAETINTGVLIIGGGVAGLSAARYLKKFTDDFMLIELEKNPGGNSMGGENSVSAFPWGAHYLPLPGDQDPELIDFLKEADVITGMKNGLPLYNEYYLCHDPKERLYINHHWQEGIIPRDGLPVHDREEIARFLGLMHDYKELKGDDHRHAFAIPVENSSEDKKIRSLDKITATEFLHQNDFSSPYLKWYVNYCCADDYGSSMGQTSAWAMIHYFASRRGTAANATFDTVLTWPEGNYWLVKQLKRNVADHVNSNVLAYDVTLTAAGCETQVYDASNDVTKRIVSKQVIMATPQFINQRLLKTVSRPIHYPSFRYAPWMVANLTVNAPLNEQRGEPLCWDNVIYGSNALGYVNAMHQQLSVHSNQRVITYYKPLLGDDPSGNRQIAHKKTYSDWRNEILGDLKIPHPSITSHLQEMNIWIWGHGMVMPSPGFIWSDNRVNASSSLSEKIHFAHSDLAGISIFEEAFYYGHQSAKRILAI
jgi:hypothetical protein